MSSFLESRDPNMMFKSSFYLFIKTKFLNKTHYSYKTFTDGSFSLKFSHLFIRLLTMSANDWRKEPVCLFLHLVVIIMERNKAEMLNGICGKL